MILLGTRVFRVKNVIRDRRAGWADRFAGELPTAFNDTCLNNDELIAALVRKNRFERLRLPLPSVEKQDFQVVHEGRTGLTETFYSFQRALSYDGDIQLWRQLPYVGFDTELRVRFSPDGRGEIILAGFCTREERKTVDRYIYLMIAGLQPALAHLQCKCELYNTALGPAAETFVRNNQALIDSYRTSALS